MYMYSEGYSNCFVRVCVSLIYMYMYYSGGLHSVTGGYRGLQRVTLCKKRLQCVTLGYRFDIWQGYSA